MNRGDPFTGVRDGDRAMQQRVYAVVAVAWAGEAGIVLTMLDEVLALRRYLEVAWLAMQRRAGKKRE